MLDFVSLSPVVMCVFFTAGRMLGHQGSILLKEGELYEAQELLKEALEYTDDSFKNIPLTATILYNLSLLR